MITLQWKPAGSNWIEPKARGLGYEPCRAMHRLGKAVASAFSQGMETHFELRDQKTDTGLILRFKATTFERNLGSIQEFILQASYSYYEAALKDGHDPITRLEALIEERSRDFPSVFVDMDDVVADFSGGFCRRFERHHLLMTKDEMWSHIDSDSQFYEKLRPTLYAERFMRAIGKIPKHAYLSSSRTKQIATQKSQWIKNIVGPSTYNFIPVLPEEGTAKFDKSIWASDGEILIDDYGLNVDQWNAAGGKAIHHYSCFDSAERLVNLVQEHLGIKPEDTQERTLRRA